MSGDQLFLVVYSTERVSLTSSFVVVLSHVSTGEGTGAVVNIFNGNTVKGPLCRTSEISHHAVGGSAASVSELSLVLQEWTAAVLSELYAQTGLNVCLVLSSLLSQHRKVATYYDLLGVKSDATLDEIKNAFFDKSKKLHPDSDPSNPALHSQFVQLNEAYRVLSKELSRKEYDFKIRQPYGGGQAFGSASNYPSYRASTHSHDNIRYWEQFRHSQDPETTAEEWQKRRRRRNFRLVAYCIIAMMLSIGTHAVFFKKLEEVHNNFMDEKDRVILEIYNEAKERARINGFKKQTEILRQKHAEFKEKYSRNGGGDDK